ncbi:hypothetical protein [Hoyosella subflava]|uniref:hypothetical protein n=1 Tax=Hoyosella subflava TaxID=639313 RepID=UPI00067435A6|nr:hypothetical protein [Hoyosella subflava]
MSARPLDALAPPVAVDPIPDILENALGFTQYVSPAYWLGIAVDTVFDFDPWQQIAEAIAGDWESLQRAGLSLANIAEFNSRFENVLNDGSGVLAKSWAGEASDAARHYFADLAQSVGGQSAAIASIGRQLQTLAVGMYEMSQVISSLARALVDYLIMLGIELAATAGLTMTGAGVPAAAIVGAAAYYQIYNILHMWQKIANCIDSAWNLAQTTVGLTAGHLGAVKSYPLKELPQAPYGGAER